MKIYIVRHGDPDYITDSLTEKGKKEAELLGEYMKRIHIDHFYVSPLGRAQETCQATLKAIGREGEAETLEWLQEYMELKPGFEFPKPPKDKKDMKDMPPFDRSNFLMHWDRLPSDWGSFEGAFDAEKWMDNPIYEGFDVRGHYERICGALDGLLEKHGYERQGHFYHPVHANNESIALYCHFGLESVLLSHLLNISPVILWHATGATPSSVTLLATEEREEGIACFRMLEYGSTAHLALGNEEPSFTGRFRECFTNDWERA